MATTYLDYQGRTVDVLAFRGVKAQGDVRLNMSLLDETTGGEVCTGVQKLAQAWVLEFLTEEGSVPYDAKRGCSFMLAAKAGRLLSEMDVFQQFNLAAPTIQRNLLRSETISDPDDERFAEARLTKVLVTPGYASLHVTIYSRAGLSRQVILPLPLAL